MEKRNKLKDGVEMRFIPGDVKIESREDGKDHLVGHTAVFNELSVNLGWFREKIDPAAFNECLDQDVRALFNHNSSAILGRTKAGTLDLSVDKRGLVYDCEVGDTTTGKDVLEHVKRGDVSGNSFQFIVEDDKWEDDEELGEIRTILKVRKLIDVGPVTFPAYPQTDVEAAKRSYDAWRATIKNEDGSETIIEGEPDPEIERKSKAKKRELDLLKMG